MAGGVDSPAMTFRMKLAALATTLAVLLGAAPILSATPATTASTSDVLGCKVEHGGAWSLNGEWVKVRCTGPKFTNPKKYGSHTYRAYAWCDRLGWQADRKAVGAWVNGNGTSIARCEANGDWGAVRWGYEWR